MENSSVKKPKNRGGVAMSNDVQFTDDNKKLLRELGLYDITIYVEPNSPIHYRHISWSQVSRNLLGCTEQYDEYTCKLHHPDADTPRVKLFVAHSLYPHGIGSFSTMGVGNHRPGELFFGHVEDDSSKTKAIFFVIHPGDWKPFQTRFRTDTMSDLLREGAQFAVSKISAKLGVVVGAAIGSAVPVAGTAVGAVAGYCVGEISDMIFDSMWGDHLRFIGK
jgi:hypothetical protein